MTRFHPTLVLAQREQYGQEIERHVLFPSHIGSRSTKPQNRPTFLKSVSIPHWFSLNKASHKSITPFISFPSHIGSRSTNSKHPFPEICPLVSIPHWFSLNLPPNARVLDCFCVSIPHWFSLNLRAGSSHSSGKSFHPTLVLAQQPLLQKLYRITGGKVKSSCENRIQTSRAGQSPFSPALTKYGSFTKIGYLII